MTTASTTSLWSSVARQILGKKIVRIDRVLYAFGGKVGPEGPLEIQLDDGAVFLFTGAANGETLRVKSEAWVDPFEGPLSPENEQFVAESGKWTRVPVSAVAPYSELIGLEVLAVELLNNRFETEAGISFETAARTLWMVVECDEDDLHWEFPPHFGTRERFTDSKAP